MTSNKTVPEGSAQQRAKAVAAKAEPQP